MDQRGDEQYLSSKGSPKAISCQLQEDNAIIQRATTADSSTFKPIQPIQQEELDHE